MNIKRAVSGLFVLALIAGPAFGFARPAEAAVTLRNGTDVSRPVVRLSDVFDGLPDGIDCNIARAPAPGNSITYDVSVLTHLAELYNLDWRPASTADHATITTSAVRLANADLRAAVAGKIKSLGIKGDIDVLFDNRLPEINLPGDRAPDFALNNFEYDAVNRRFHAELTAEGFAGPIDLPLMGHIAVRRDVPVLTRRLEAGTIIAAADIDWLSVSDDRLAGAVRDASQLIGFELRRDTDGDQPVPEHDVMPPRLVVRGSLVTMEIESPLMMVTAQGRALQDGKRGDVVRVTNTQSNRTVEGTVEDTGTVRIPLAQKIAAAADGGSQE